MDLIYFSPFFIFLGVIFLFFIFAGNAYLIASILKNKNLKNWAGIHIATLATLGFFVGIFLLVYVISPNNPEPTNVYYVVFFLLSPTLNALVLLSGVLCCCLLAWKKKHVITNRFTFILLALVTTPVILTMSLTNFHKIDENQAMFFILLIILLLFMMTAFFIIKKFKNVNPNVNIHQPDAVYRHLSVEIGTDNADDPGITGHKLLFSVSGLFIICWFPRFLCQLYGDRDILKLGLDILGTSMTALFPLLCICISSEFREIFKKIKCSCLNR